MSLRDKAKEDKPTNKLVEASGRDLKKLTDAPEKTAVDSKMKEKPETFVKFTKPKDGYRAGEVARFTARDAAKKVLRGVAVMYDPNSGKTGKEIDPKEEKRRGKDKQTKPASKGSRMVTK